MTLLSCSLGTDWRPAIELTKFLRGELREALIGKGADQQVGLAPAAVPGAESELATEHIERLSIVRRY
jgi:hypothetical protein